MMKAGASKKDKAVIAKMAAAGATADTISTVTRVPLAMVKAMMHVDQPEEVGFDEVVEDDPEPEPEEE